MRPRELLDAIEYKEMKDGIGRDIMTARLQVNAVIEIRKGPVTTMDVYRNRLEKLMSNHIYGEIETLLDYYKPAIIMGNTIYSSEFIVKLEELLNRR